MKNKSIILLFLLSYKAFSIVDFVNNSGYTLPHTYQPGNNCEKKGYVTVGFAVNYETNNNQFLLERSTDPNFGSWFTVNIFNGCGTCGSGNFQFDDYGIGLANNQFPSDGTVYHYRVRSQSNSLNYQTFTIGPYTAANFTSENWEDQVANSFVVSSTSNNESSYNWQIYSNLLQGVRISIVPTEIADIYIEQNNSKIEFNSEPSYPFVSLEVNINNSGYTSLYSGSGTTTFIWNSLGVLNNLGLNNLKLRYTGLNSTIIYREYRVNTVPISLELHKSNNCDVIRMYGDPSRPNSIPIIISEGYDSNNSTSIQFYRSVGDNLINCLISKGFKVYIINYKYNSQDIRNNAAIYSSAVRYISSINNNVSIVAGGLSMGGVIARYALAKAEGNNNPLPAYKFVSIDAPQQGAVISKDLQDFKYTQQINSPNSSYLLQSLNNDAAKELLIYNRFDQSAGIRNTFYSELNNLNGNGYPHLTENIGVSFSSPTPHNILGQTWLRIDALNPIYQFNVQTFQISSDEDQAGSFLPQSSTNLDPVTQTIKWWLNYGGVNPLIYALNSIDVTFTKYLNPTFIPHVSSLDIVNSVSKFDKTISTSNSTFHDQVPSDIIEPLINAIIKDDIFIQNKTYNSNHITIAGKNILAGNNVTTNNAQGNVNVNSGVNVIYKAGELIQLKDGFRAIANSNFTAKIEKVYCDGISENQFRAINKSSDQITKEKKDGNIENVFEISIYPNPTTGDLFVNFLSKNKKTGFVIIEDLTGKALLQQEINKSEGFSKLTLNVNGFVDGLYILKIVDSNGSLIKTEKIILNK